ncbi:hypothetical protein [Staphylococcus gallinarum]|uniref:hypothetical protein n=1 Tax=Staphylococcus gallinarum TaxID=1293 RepID=UPI0030C29A48
MTQEVIEFLSVVKGIAFAITFTMVIVAIIFYFMFKKIGDYHESPFEDYNFKVILRYCGVIGGGTFILGIFIWVWISTLT